jgi:hypothetical protein
MKLTTLFQRYLADAVGFVIAGFFWGVGIILAIKLADLLIK